MTTSLSARDVLRTMIATYASMTSYSDKGQVTTTQLKDGRVHRTTFSTLYQRPSFFRFAFSRPHPHPPLNHLVTQFVTGFDGTVGYSTTSKPGDAGPSKSVTSLELAVAGATGISSGSAHTIGRLLLPEVGGYSFQESLEPQFGKDVTVDGTLCYSISARNPRSETADEIWIEKESFLLRKIIRRRADGQSEEWRDSIELNAPLESHLFQV
jgi:hypothetical protein